MTLQKFISNNRKELDKYIAHALKMGKNPRANNEERRLWILNDDGLYNWARGEGCKI